MGEVILDSDEVKKEFFNLLRSLKKEEWYVKVNSRWAVKDVIAHLVAWEEEAAVCLREAWQTKQKPWFLLTDNFDDFNKRAVNKYKNYSPKQLLERWDFVIRVLDSEIKDIGVGNLRLRPDLFEWVFDEGEDGHYLEHFQQIKKVLGKGL